MTGIIVTGVDNSVTAQKAAEKAARMAEAFGYELHVLTAFSADVTGALRTSSSSLDPDVTGGALRETVSRFAEEAVEISSSVASGLRSQFPRVSIKSRAVEGSPGATLVREAERLNAEIVVVGNKRVQGATRILGSIAGTVAREAHCDIYVVNTTQYR